MSNVSISYLLILGWVWLVGCAPAEPIQVTRIVQVTVIVTLPATPIMVTATSLPQPSPSPTVSPTSSPEAALRPTHTTTPAPPTPTPRPSPTLDPSFVVGQLPAITHDLLFIADGSLKRWNHVSSQIDTLLASEAQSGSVSSSWRGRIGDIRAYSVSVENQMVVASRLANIDPPSYDVILLSLIENSSEVLLDSVAYLLDFEIAPNGRQLAYMVGDPNGDMDDYGPYSGSIYSQAVDDNQPAYAIGYCSNITAASEHKNQGCNDLSWHPDNEHLLWADAQGLWQYDLSDSEITLLLANRYDGSDILVYRPLVWSPGGRYLRLEVGFWEGYQEAVFDIQTRRVMEIPHTMFIIGRPPEFAVSLLQDDRLFVSWEQPEGGVTLEGWRIEPEEGELALEDSLILPSGPASYLVSPSQHDNGSIGFAIFIFDSQTNEQSGLCRLNSWNSAPQLVASLPGNRPFYQYGAVYWLPDGRGALVSWEDEIGFEHFTYIPTDGPSFYELSSALGLEVDEDSFTWLP